MSKKIMISFLVFLFIYPSLILGNSGISKKHFAENEIEFFYESSFIDEYPLADEYIKRGEFITILLKSQKVKTDIMIPPFKDYYKIKNEYKPYISYAYYNDILYGSKEDDGIYSNWDKYIKREEAYTIIGRLLKIEIDENLESGFTDKDNISYYSLDYINYFENIGLANGYLDGSFKPDNYITYGESIYLFNSIYKDENVDIVYEDTITNFYAGTSGIGYENKDLLDSSFINPKGIEIYNDSIIVADSGSKLVRKLNGEVSTLFGNVLEFDNSGIPIGSYLDGYKNDARLISPMYLEVYENGDIVFTEDESNVIRKYIKKIDAVATFYDGTSTLNQPTGIALDIDENLYVADTFNNQIKLIKNNEISLIIGNGETGYKDGSLDEAMFNEPTGLFFYENELYILDSGNSLIRKIEDDKVITIAGSITDIDEETNSMIGGFKDGNSNEALFRYPQGIYIEDNIIYITDTYNNAIRKIENDYVSTLAGNGDYGNSIGSGEETNFNLPFDLIVRDNKIYISDSRNNGIKYIEIDKD